MTDAPTPDLLAALAADEPTAAPGTTEYVSQLIDRLVDARGKLDALKSQVKEAQAAHDDLATRQLPEALAAAGLKNATRPDGVRVQLQQRFYASVRTDEQEAVLAWLREHGHGDLIREIVHPQTLKAFCREQLENGATLPPGVSTHVETTAVLYNRRTMEDQQ